MRNFAKSLLVLAARVYLRTTAGRRSKRPLRIIRSTSAFFGHLALEPENYLSAHDSKTPSWANDRAGMNGRDWWTLGKVSASPNPTLAKAWKRHVEVPPSWWIDALIRAGEHDPKCAIPQVSASLFGVGNALDVTPSHFSLSERELRDARREIEGIGIDLSKPYVALIVRDEKYFDKIGKKLSDGRMRNRAIADFAPAATALAKQGVQVIRLGSLVASELEVDHPLVFDYANSGQRSELLDVFIPLTAMGSISTLTGSDAVAIVGRRPVLYVDIALYAQVFHSTKCSTWIPARLRDTRAGRVLTLTEAFSRGIGWFVEPTQFASEGIEPLRSSPAEIAEYATEFVGTVLQRGRYVGDEALQSAARTSLSEAMGEDGFTTHGEVRSQILDSFLRKHGDFISPRQ